MMKSVHGGDIYSRRVELDFSANINPLGMPDTAKKAIVENIGAYEHYPDVNCTTLKGAIADFESVSGDFIVCGNGAADLIHRTVHVEKPKKALLIAPTFSEYEKALRSVSCEIEYFMLDERDNFSLSDKITDRLDSSLDMLFICSPNNPVGNIADIRLLERIAQICNEKNIRLVADECFLSFCDNAKESELSLRFKTTVVLKAFTKIFAMAGLRLGYMLCSDTDFCERVESFGQCWSVSSVAQAAGEAALLDDGYIEKTVRYVGKERSFLGAELSRLGIRVYPSQANFILFRADPMLGERLLKLGIAVRSCRDYRGLDESFFRTAVRTHDENIRLINSIERILKHG